ncbi:MAG: AAA family ATPase [Candidatus Omnitrophica bacterium]|nr:AAA family ATPase [Candidatus Omnitrophota bacterium]
MSLLEKFAPKKLNDCIGNKEAIARIKQWFLGFMVSKKQKPLLIYGPVGCGKSAAINALINEFDINPIFIQPTSDDEEVKKLQSRLEELSYGTSLNSSLPLIVFENIDFWGIEKSKNVLNVLSNFLKKTNIPVILTANDIYEHSISAIRYVCEPLQFKAVNPSNIFVLLVEISQKSKIYLSNEELKKIAQNSNGDIRAAINDLEARNTSTFREQQKNQFELIRTIFRISSYKETQAISFLIGSSSNKETLKIFISENIPIEFKSKIEISGAYSSLSKADVYDGRIVRSQYWGFLRYSTYLLLLGVASNRQGQKNYFTPYKFPSFLQKMSFSKNKRQIKKSILLKIAKKLHCTTKKALTYLSLLSEQIKVYSKYKIEEKLQSLYGLEEEEILFLKNN